MKFKPGDRVMLISYARAVGEEGSPGRVIGEAPDMPGHYFVRSEDPEVPDAIGLFDAAELRPNDGRRDDET